MRGTAFIDSVRGLERNDLDEAIYQAVVAGHFVRWPLVTIPVERGFVEVWSDYFAIGTPEDHVRMPMGAPLAQRVADHLGCLLPTTRIVDLCWAQADVRLQPRTMAPGPRMMSPDWALLHQEAIQTQLGGQTGLITGHKKDVVITNRLAKHHGRVAIYGWHRLDGRPIQPLSLVHVADYRDYSHGLRLVASQARLRGTTGPLEELLRNDETGVLSEEGPMYVTRIGVTWPHETESAPRRPTLRRGLLGQDVRAWQEALVACGFPVLVDGVFGRKTERATMDFQSRFGLKPDGIVGPRTWDMERQISESTPTQPSVIPTSTSDIHGLPFVSAKHFTPATGRDIQLVVLHTAEIDEKPTGAEAVARFFATTERKVSAHYCVDSDSVVQCVRDRDIAWAAPGSNHNGIHIELSGFARQTPDEWRDPYSYSMLVLAAKLVAHLCQVHGLPVKRLGVAELLAAERGITEHRAVSVAFKKSTHTDPGPHFPWDWFLELVEQVTEA